jgi:hypothetical protein
MAKKKRRLSKSRYQESYRSKDKGGSSRIGILDFKKLEESPQFFSPTSGINKINIIPFEVTSKKHPLVKSGVLEKGDLDYVLDIWIHRYVGPNNADILCPKKTYGKPCPICENVQKLYDEGDKKNASADKAQRRVLYNVQPIIRGEAQSLHIWEISHFLFEKELIQEARECANGEDIIPFADLEEGSVIKFSARSKSMNGNEFYEFKSFDFLDREEELDEDLVEETVSFDDLLIIHSYEEIEKIYLLGDDEDDDDENEVEPSKRKKSNKNSRVDDENETEDEIEIDEDEDEEEKVVSSKKKNKVKECPYDHEWGADCDKKKECRKCKLWDDCMEDQED